MYLAAEIAKLRAWPLGIRNRMVTVHHGRIVVDVLFLCIQIVVSAFCDSLFVSNSER